MMFPAIRTELLRGFGIFGVCFAVLIIFVIAVLSLVSVLVGGALA